MKSDFNDPWLDALACNEQSIESREIESIKGYFNKSKLDDETYLLKDNDRETRMMAYLKAKNAFPTTQKSTSHFSIKTYLSHLLSFLPKVSSMQPVLASIALLIIGSAVLLNNQTTHIDPLVNLEIYRGNQPIIHITVGDALKTAQDISAILQKHNVAHRNLNLSNNKVRIEAKLTNNKNAIESELKQWNISVPANGILIIVVESN